MIKKLFIITFLFSGKLFAADGFMTAGIGMVNISYAESKSSIKPEENTGDGIDAEAGSISVITMAVNYEYPISINTSVFSRLNLPLAGSGDSTYLSAGVGMNYFFNQINTDIISLDKGTKLEIVPKFRYYVGGQINSAYYVYTTETKKKSDILIELGAQVGILYNIGEKYGVHVEGMFGRGTGVNTTTSNLKILAAMIYKF